MKTASWIARVNSGLKLRAEGEKIIAAALRERLNKVGEKKWLDECDRTWGWSRTTTYRHLNPKLMAAARAHTCEQRAKEKANDVPTVGTLVVSDPAECGCTRRSASEPHAAGCDSTSAKRMAATVRGCQCDLRSGEDVLDRWGNVIPEECRHTRDCTKYRGYYPPARKEELTRSIESAQRAAEARVAMTETPGYHEDHLEQAILNKLRPAIDEIEAEHGYLTLRLIERLDEQWKRLGAVIERYGDEGGGVGQDQTSREREDVEVAS